MADNHHHAAFPAASGVRERIERHLEAGLAVMRPGVHSLIDIHDDRQLELRGKRFDEGERLDMARRIADRPASARHND